MAYLPFHWWSYGLSPFSKIFLWLISLFTDILISLFIDNHDLSPFSKIILWIIYPFKDNLMNYLPFLRWSSLQLGCICTWYNCSFTKKTKGSWYKRKQYYWYIKFLVSIFCSLMYRTKVNPDLPKIIFCLNPKIIFQENVKSEASKWIC